VTISKFCLTFAKSFEETNGFSDLNGNKTGEEFVSKRMEVQKTYGSAEV
jgi:hypothetical protein